MPGLLAGLIIVFLLGLLFALIARIIDSFIAADSRADRRARFRKAKRLRAQEREQNFRQQLQKPTFESRLKNFAGRCQREQHSVSKMQYWQAEDLELKYAPAKPIELIQAALIRLSKLFCGK